MNVEKVFEGAVELALETSQLIAESPATTQMHSVMFLINKEAGVDLVQWVSERRPMDDVDAVRELFHAHDTAAAVFVWEARAIHTTDIEFIDAVVVYGLYPELAKEYLHAYKVEWDRRPGTRVNHKVQVDIPPEFIDWVGKALDW